MHLQTTASRAATLLAKNPLLFGKVMISKLNALRPLPPLPARRQIGGIVFECDLADYRGTAPMYFGSYAPLVVEVMKRFVRPGDAFIDVGANVGYLSATAANLVGRTGSVHCFEPIPRYVSRLRRLADLNPAYTIAINACALGENAGLSAIHVTREAGQSTLVSGYKSARAIESSLHVSVARLDSYLQTHSIRPALIKIDAEGFEFPILRGLENYFRRFSHRPPIVCEVAPRAYPLLGCSLDEFARYMAGYGYSARDVIDGETPVDIRALEHVDDVLFTSEGK